MAEDLNRYIRSGLIAMSALSGYGLGWRLIGAKVEGQPDTWIPLGGRRCWVEAGIAGFAGGIAGLTIDRNLGWGLGKAIPPRFLIIPWIDVGLAVIGAAIFGASAGVAAGKAYQACMGRGQ